jgi:hypothetical protein
VGVGVDVGVGVGSVSSRRQPLTRITRVLGAPSFTPDTPTV